MVGLTYDQAPSQWDKDISEAKSAGIDGFALNIGTDTYTDEQLGLAYNAAAAAGGFQLFLSFDMAASSWSVDQVVSLINTYKDNANQHKVDGLPFVSTFEGPNWEGWDTVRASTGGIFLVPDWSSLGPAGVTARLDTIDGACKKDSAVLAPRPSANPFVSQLGRLARPESVGSHDRCRRCIPVRA